MNDFVLIIAKCQIIHGLNNEGLNNIIENARNMRIKTISENKSNNNYIKNVSVSNKR
jgi:hypothetical protein